MRSSAIEPREHRFSRRQPGPRGSWREDVIVANPDLVAVVFSADRPPPNPRLIDRFLVVGEYNEVPTLLVANKVDLVGSEAARGAFGSYERIGYDVVYTSAKAGIGLEELRERLAGRLSIVTGPSGAGKSTLLNTLQPGLQLTTGEVSAVESGKGKHTTTHAELHPLERAAGRIRGRHARHPRARPVADPRFPSWRRASPSSARTSVHAPSTTARTSTSLAAGCVRPSTSGAVSEERYDSYRRMLTGDLAS